MVKQLLSTLLHTATKPLPVWAGALILVVSIAGIGSAATYVSTTVNALHVAGGGTVIDSQGAGANQAQNMSLGSFSSGNIALGIVNQNVAYMGCTGLSISACTVNFYADGTGSPIQARIDSTGDFFANADMTRKFGTFLSSTSVAGVSCNNFFWHNGTNPMGCADQTGDLGLNADLDLAGSGTVISGANAPIGTSQNMILGSYTSGVGAFQAGNSSQYAPYIGCTGVSQNCTFSFYTAGTGSAATSSLNNLGTWTALGNFIANSGVFYAGGSTTGNPLFEKSGSNAVIGCVGSAQSCPLYVYAQGVGSAQTQQFNADGSITATYFKGSSGNLCSTTSGRPCNFTTSCTTTTTSCSSAVTVPNGAQCVAVESVTVNDATPVSLALQTIGTSLTVQFYQSGSNANSHPQQGECF